MSKKGTFEWDTVKITASAFLESTVNKKDKTFFQSPSLSISLTKHSFTNNFMIFS